MGLGSRREASLGCHETRVCLSGLVVFWCRAAASSQAAQRVADCPSLLLVDVVVGETPLYLRLPQELHPERPQQEEAEDQRRRRRFPGS